MRARKFKNPTLKRETFSFSWMLTPFRWGKNLLHPPLPTALDVIRSDVQRAKSEIESAQRELVRIEYLKEIHLGVVNTNRKRLARLASDADNLMSHGDLTPVHVAHVAQVFPSHGVRP